MAKRSIPELSLDTQTIEKMLAAVNVGDIVTYAAMSGAIGRDTQGKARHHIASARRRLLSERHMVFGAVVNVGMRRLDDIGKVSQAGVHAHKGRNQFRKTLHNLRAVDDFAALPNDQKLAHSMLAVKAGSVLHFTSGSKTRQIETAITSAKKEFSPHESFDLLKKHL